MNSKETKKTSNFQFNDSQVIDFDKCSKIKGGGWYYCCTRNKWI